MGQMMQGAVAFGPSADGSTKETVKIGPLQLSEEGTARLLAALASARQRPEIRSVANISMAAEVGEMQGDIGDGPLIGPEATFSNTTITPLPECGAHQPTRAHNVYHLIGEDMQPLARNVKSFAFAYALALRWSRDLEQPIKLMRRMEDSDIGDISQLSEVVDASAFDSGAYLERSVHAEIARIRSAAISLREIADDVRCMIEDADDAISALRALADTRAVPASLVAQAARSAADHFDCLNWYTLIADVDTEMQGELLAVSGDDAA